jgi:hypothetical protein
MNPGDWNDAEPGAAPHASDRAASLIADCMTVAFAADAALFDPLATSDERSRAAYEAALRVRRELKATSSAKERLTNLASDRTGPSL